MGDENQRLNGLEEESDTLLAQILENPSNTSPAGKLIVQLNNYLKKPKIEDDLSSIMETYLRYLTKCQVYLNNGVFNTNFAEGALLIQSATLLYSKKVDLLWDSMVSYQERLTLYEEKTVDKSVLAKIEERKERFKRKRKAKIKTVDFNALFQEDYKPLNLEDILLAMDEPNEFTTDDLKIKTDVKSLKIKVFIFKRLYRKLTSLERDLIRYVKKEDFPKITGFNYMLTRSDTDEDNLDDDEIIEDEKEQLFNYKDSSVVHSVLHHLNYIYYLNFYHNVPIDEIKLTDGYEHVTNQYLFEKNMPFSAIYDELDKYHASAKEYLKNFVQILYSKKLQLLSQKLCPKQPSIVLERLSDDVIKSYIGDRYHDNISIDEELKAINECHTPINEKSVDTQSEAESGYFEGNEFDKTSRNTPITPNRIISPISECDQNAHINNNHLNENDTVYKSMLGQVEDDHCYACHNLSENKEAADNYEDDHTLADTFNDSGFVTESADTEDLQKESGMDEHDYFTGTDHFNDSGIGLDSSPCTPNKTIIEELPHPHKYTTRKRQLNFDVEEEMQQMQLAKKPKKIRTKRIKLRPTTTTTLKSFELFFYSNYTPEDGEGLLIEPEIESDDDFDIEENNNDIIENLIDNNAVQDEYDAEKDDVIHNENHNVKEINDSNGNPNIEEKNDSIIPNITVPNIKSNETVVSNDMARKDKVNYQEWRRFILKKIRKQKDIDFDIHEEGKKIIDNLGEIGNSMKYAEICNGKPTESVCRTFIAMLELANNYNVEINNNIKPAHLANDTLEIKLLAKKQNHLNLKSFNAPSEISLQERMSKVREAMTTAGINQEFTDFNIPKINRQLEKKNTNSKTTKRSYIGSLENLSIDQPRTNSITQFLKPASITNKRRKNVEQSRIHFEPIASTSRQQHISYDQSRRKEEMHSRQLGTIQQHVDVNQSVMITYSRRQHFAKLETNIQQSQANFESGTNVRLPKYDQSESSGRPERQLHVGQLGICENQHMFDDNQSPSNENQELIEKQLSIGSGSSNTKQRQPIYDQFESTESHIIVKKLGNQRQNKLNESTSNERQVLLNTILHVESTRRSSPILLNFTQRDIRGSPQRQSPISHSQGRSPNNSGSNRTSPVLFNIAQPRTNSLQPHREVNHTVVNNQLESCRTPPILLNFSQPRTIGTLQRQLNFRQPGTSRDQPLVLNLQQSETKSYYHSHKRRKLE